MPRRPFQPSHLYAQVRNELARRIAAGEYAPGSLLPNEFSLSQEMQVSVGTVRKAVEMLHGEKLVSRSQGRGTIVADRQSADYRSKFDRLRHPNGAPIAWTFRELLREVRAPTEEERQKLQISADQRLISICRVRETGGEAVKIEYSRLPLDVFGPLDGLDASETTVENLSVLRGVPLSYSDERLTIVPADAEQALQFDISVGMPIMRLERIVYDGANKPVEWRIATCHLGDRQYHVPSPIGSRSAK
jgi:GntR family transcriptional regulator